MAEEEDHSGIVWKAELPVDGQAQQVAVEAAATVYVAGAWRIRLLRTSTPLFQHHVE
jgi:hypothetical protein